ncbi:MAG TPA: DnaB-like helicase N-terminal domain-containing protein, partial [Pseudomonadota bacterium]|nr:DnaB-like helicase N-terminal domain-containing protein [Pseudomonadota bacterium]
MATKRFSSNERPATAQGGVAVHTLPPSAGPEGGPVRRVLPHSVDAEESVIGGLLFSGRAMTLVADIINSDDFYDAKHEAIYAA